MPPLETFINDDAGLFSLDTLNLSALHCKHRVRVLLLTATAKKNCEGKSNER